MVVPQLDPKLTNPIDNDAPPTIYGSALTPELATAALNLPIDFLKQKESLANKHVARHPITLSVIMLAVAVYMGNSCVLPAGPSQSVIEQLTAFAVLNKKELISAIIVLCVVSSLTITTLAKMNAALFKSKTDAILESKGANIFKVNLSNLAEGDSEVAKSEEVNNTHVVVYRETPIALVSVKENKGLSTKDTLVVGVSTIGCRFVYLKSGILEDLLDWALVRTKKIQKQSGKYSTGQSMKLLVDVYSFDKYMKSLLKKKGFSHLESFKLPEDRILSSIFGVRRELWGVQFHFESAEEK
ncbi:ADR325Cp [Eremothecium gossypii ATCC 10895]|uniref:ADR325Cp n=1 Tax=Eremothecium gossypii (strain ATCC 10895 / CBS 109.51 / FGSC 9923 / NRRL Y-1056) TaxID=284811 RepID=Q759F1_EREGS|nr:ADR325Cp [Eremothecium gossypii ATCC 10895]AAS52245.2 ADR325Cp [Eremothecium gossypii ATCC 10895]AEY96544.1 FADR325Cp [Eremothecium gossypii FDAG1]